MTRRSKPYMLKQFKRLSAERRVQQFDEIIVGAGSAVR